MRAERANIVSQRTPFDALRLLRASYVARLAQIPFDFAQGKLSLRKERLLRMTSKLTH
jgi:hypothetical protein